MYILNCANLYGVVQFFYLVFDLLAFFQLATTGVVTKLKCLNKSVLLSIEINQLKILLSTNSHCLVFKELVYEIRLSYEIYTNMNLHQHEFTLAACCLSETLPIILNYGLCVNTFFASFSNLADTILTNLISYSKSYYLSYYF